MHFSVKLFVFYLFFIKVEILAQLKTTYKLTVWFKRLLNVDALLAKSPINGAANLHYNSGCLKVLIRIARVIDLSVCKTFDC